MKRIGKRMPFHMEKKRSKNKEQKDNTADLVLKAV